MGYQLRQDPDNDCILQQYVDGEWIFAFDYSLCMAPVLDGIQTIQDQRTSDDILQQPLELKDLIQDYRDRIGESGTSSDYDPDLTNEDGTGQGAICDAVKTVVNGAITASKTYKSEESEDIDRAALAVGIGVAIGAVVVAAASGGLLGPAAAGFLSTYFAAGSAAAVATPLVLGLTTAGLAAWAQAVKDADAALFDNTDAADEVICAWYTYLRYRADISLNDFQNDIDLDDASEDAVSLWEIIRPLAQQEASYMAFLRAWKRNAAFEAVGVEPDCTCEDVPDLNIIASQGTSTFLGKAGEFKDRYRFSGDSGYYPTFNVSDSLGQTYYILDIVLIGGEFNFYNSTLGVGGGYFYTSATGTFDEPLLTDNPGFHTFGGIGQGGSANYVVECIVSRYESGEPPTP